MKRSDWLAITIAAIVGIPLLIVAYGAALDGLADHRTADERFGCSGAQTDVATGECK
jgi:hypothetical protein